MAKKTASKLTVETLKHSEATRKNIPTAEYQSVMQKNEQSPVRIAYERRNRDLDPQLVWRGKDEQDWSDLVVHAPPLYIQEKVHPKVLIDDLRRQTTEAKEQQSGFQPDLFADFNGLPDSSAKTEFYQHDAHWSNRMILGDSLKVMASLAEREGLRGQVQCIYLDPPYGIKFNSNFQWSTKSRDVKDGNKDHITREPEQVKAFRDTWRDGIHSYPSIPNIFPSNDAFLKKEDPHISYFAETLETACAAFECKRYGEMFAAFGSRIPPIKTHAFKLRWSEMMDGLVALRKNGTVGEVVEYIRGGGLLRLPEKMEERERSLAQWKPEPDVEEPGRIKRLRELREVPYKEIIELVRFIDGHTPFSTKHGVKGAEFENVLVVLGRGWNQYNFEQMLEWGGGHGSVPAGKQETFERNRNLFYVACSRPKVRLALLFTQHLSDTAMRTLSDWFGTETLESLPSVVEL